MSAHRAMSAHPPGCALIFVSAIIPEDDETKDELMNEFTATPEGALMSACALAALMLIVIALVTSRGARARAREKARAWAEIKRPDWEARAARKRADRESGARASARLRALLLSAVGLVALAATNLSAHATITAMQRVGLHSVDTAISVVVVFEAFLAILAVLSWWHMNHGDGFNRYEVGVWSMAALMGSIAWWGGENLIFALWPMLAAIAWHMVITFGREGKQNPLARWWRLKRGKATAQDATAVDTERRISQIVRCAYMANEGPRIARAFAERAFNRAWARADELGILTPEVRARIQTRLAARYAGARALAPEAVAHMNPWNERAQSARTARAVRPVSAPPARAIEASALVPDDARALTDEGALTSAQAPTTRAHDVLDALAEHFGGPAEARQWAEEFYRANGELPNRNHLAEAFNRSAGNCGKWMTPVRKALGLS